MGDRRCCCNCPDLLYSFCGTMDDIHVLFYEEEEIGTWYTDVIDEVCVVVETSGTGQMIGKWNTSAYQEITWITRNVQDGDRFSILAQWIKTVDPGTGVATRKWYEFRYDRNSINQVTLSWYSHEQVDGGADVENLLAHCHAVTGVWPYPDLGANGSIVKMHTCIGPVAGTDPPLVELYGEATTNESSKLRLWARTGSGTTTGKYHAGFATSTPTHDAIVEYLYVRWIVPSDPMCQCYRTCECTDDVAGSPTIYPPAKLLLTYIGYDEGPGEDDCTSLSGITIELEIVPCGGDVTWVGYTGPNSGCLADSDWPDYRVRYVLSCPSQPMPTDPSWFSSAKDWKLVIDQEQTPPYGHLHKICIAPWGFTTGAVTLYSIVPPSTCHPFMLVFEYGPGVTWPEDGMYQGFFEMAPDSQCPPGCAPCGSSLIHDPVTYHHIHWRCIVTYG